MKSIVQHAAPNVVSGVNFDVTKFDELFAWMSAMSSDKVHALLLPYQYGLILPYDGKPALQIRKTGDKIVVHRCSAITSRGVIIGVFDGITPILELDLTKKNELKQENEYHIVIEIDTQHRQTFGPTSIDMPERPMFTMPQYNLNIRDKKGSIKLPSDVLEVGLLTYEEKEWILKDYVPPCVHIGASSVLRDKYTDYQADLKKLLDYLPKVIRQTDHFKDKATIELREFCIHTGSFLSQRASEYYNLSQFGSPYQMIALWSGFSGLAYFLLQRLKEVSRQQFYDLLKNNTHGVGGIIFNPNYFESILKEFGDFSFQQHQISEAIEKTDEVLNVIIPLFKIFATRYNHSTQKAWTNSTKEDTPKTTPPKKEKKSNLLGW